jgi:hypothetical protein
MVKETLAKIRDIGCTARYRDGEFRVNLMNGTEATAYYTNLAADAIATAHAMRDRVVRGFREAWRG